MTPSRKHTSIALLAAISALPACAEHGPRRAAAPGDVDRPARTNVLLLTVDDLQWSSLGVTGCGIPDLTPNLDRLASEGLRFENAFVTVSVCQPCREALLTGLYPHRSGAVGFRPIDSGVRTLPCELERAGYLVGLVNKVEHIQPSEQFCWDVSVDRVGRVPNTYYEIARDFFERANTEKRPFFLVANITDPHRPFPVDVEAIRRRLGERAVEAIRKHAFSEYLLSPADRYFTADEVEVPGFLEDLPAIRRDLAGYFTAVKRGDESVGRVLRALDESGAADDTLVIFLSDHGMAFPFAKSNCYPASTRTPLMIRWPGHTKPGVVDGGHFIEGIDLMPTILDAVGLAPIDDLDGDSFLPVIEGRRQPELDHAFTFHDTSHAGVDLPMRSVLEGRYCYIYNAWVDGDAVYQSNLEETPTWRAMVRAADDDARIAARVQSYFRRPREELFDCVADPSSRVNLADRAEHAELKERLRARIASMMKSSGDPLLDDFLAAFDHERP